MASLNSIDLGDIQSERQSKRGQLFQQPIPTRDSNYAILLDIFGMNRTITINGTIIGTQTEQTDFINLIEGIMNGSQSGVTFVSSKTGFANKTVFIDNFEWGVEKANVGKIDYTLTLIEGAAIA